MALKIMVNKNHLPTCKDPYIIRSGNSDVVEFDRFVDKMANGRTTLTKPDLVAAMELYFEELKKELSEGRIVRTPTGSFFLSAKGSLGSVDESFSPSLAANNHDIRLHHRVDPALEAAIRAELKVIREEKPDRASPLIFSAAAAGEESGAPLSAGGILALCGKRLRFDPKEAVQGLFFRDGSGAETRASLYPLVNPSMVLACVPETLAPGPYSLIVRTLPNGKELREAKLEGLEVVASR